MNVFEDLITELKEENLLESAVIEPGLEGSDDVDLSHLEETEVPNKRYDLPGYVDEYESATIEIEEESSVSETVPGLERFGNVSDDPYQEVDPSERLIDDSISIHETEVTVSREAAISVMEDPAHGKRVRKGKEFFRKRAMGEVSSLQMVEHVLTGVEREYMKVVPKTFDDFNAKKALHSFLQLDGEVNSEEHAAAEFALMQETEAWCSALAERDRVLPVHSLRQYCEKSRPALSSQALLGLARFYRNLPYSESVRSKFDFLITRLFSREADQEKRVCLFTRDEMLGHINMLYSEWSSISLYAADDDESNVLLTALSFEDLSIEAENSSTFDQLIESDFFGRLRLFKESISELFFAPNVTAAAIECNIRIGNAYVELIDRERQKLDSISIQSKYGTHNDKAISEATGRTLELVRLLKELAQPAESVAAATHEDSVREERTKRNPDVYERIEPQNKATVNEVQPELYAVRSLPNSLLEKLKNNARNVNKWFLGGCIVLILLSFGTYVYANYFMSEPTLAANAKNVDLEDSVLKDHIKVGRVAGDNFYGQLLPSWDLLPKEKRQEYLQKVLQLGRERGFSQVNLVSKEGKIVGYAAAGRTDVVMP